VGGCGKWAESSLGCHLDRPVQDGGSLLITSPGGVDECRAEGDERLRQQVDGGAGLGVDDRVVQDAEPGVDGSRGECRLARFELCDDVGAPGWPGSRLPSFGRFT
jgi:hypothetical protein